MERDELKYHYPIVEGLKMVFEKSMKQDIIKNYLPRFSHVTKWVCLSDYSIGGKTNDVLTFSFLPFIADHEELANLIRIISPSEIKNTRKIDPVFLNFLKSGPALNISVILENHKYLFATDNDSLQKLLRVDMEKMVNRDVDNWNKLRPHMRKNNENIRKKAKEVLRLIDHWKKLRIIKNLYLTTVLGGYFSAFIASQTSSEIFGWFSDRDEINDIADHFSIDLFSICFYEHLVGDTCRVVAAKATSSADEWYSDLIKIPDYLTGAIADYDFAENKVSKEKFTTIIENIYSDNITNTFLLKLRFDKSGTSVFSRLQFERISA
jgi:hypothetical protein